MATRKLIRELKCNLPLPPHSGAFGVFKWGARVWFWGHKRTKCGSRGDCVFCWQRICLQSGMGSYWLYIVTMHNRKVDRFTYILFPTVKTRVNVFE